LEQTPNQAQVRTRFRRVLLKLSGEVLAGNAGFGLDSGILQYLAEEIRNAHDLGTEIGIVIGGGNFIRGEAFSSEGTIDRAVADQMGMLGTLMNSLALQSALENIGIPTRVQSAISVSQVAENFIRRRALRHLEKGRVVVFAAGTGNPYFTTDSAAALRALEIEAQCLIKATKVDGIYDKDPRKSNDAVRYQSVSFDEVLERRLAVMDQTAFTLCRENDLPIIVLDYNQPGAIAAAVSGGDVGTIVASRTTRRES
jgi:uridylate kinase